MLPRFGHCGHRERNDVEMLTVTGWVSAGSSWVYTYAGAPETDGRGRGWAKGQKDEYEAGAWLSCMTGLWLCCVKLAR